MITALLHAVKLFGALAVSVSLFLLLPALHALFGNRVSLDNSDLLTRKKTMEIIKPEKKPEKKREYKIRKLSASHGRRFGDGMQMKFAPDLSVASGGGAAAPGGDLAAEIFEEGQTDVDPAPRHLEPVAYPHRARDMGIEGTVKIELVIGRDGSVETVSVLSSPHPSLSAAVRKTAQRWRFTPGSNNGIPVRVRAIKDIEFSLD